MSGAIFMKLGRAPAMIIIFNVFMVALSLSPSYLTGRHSSGVFGPNDLVDVIHDIPQRLAGLVVRRTGLVAASKLNSGLDLFDTFDQHQPSFILQFAIDGACFPTENAVNGYLQRCGFSVHCSASTHNQIGVPKQIETIHGFPRYDDLGILEPLRPVFSDFGFLILVTRQKNRLCAPRVAQPIHEFHKELLAFGIVIVRLGRRRPNGHYEVTIQMKLLQEHRIRSQLGRIYVFLDSSVCSDPFPGFAVQILIEQHIRHDLPTGPHEWRGLCVFVVVDHNGRNAQEIAQKDLSA